MAGPLGCAAVENPVGKWISEQNLLSSGSRTTYGMRMAKKALPPGLKQPAVEAITSGGFSEVNDPFHTGAKRLQQAEVEVTEFVASLEAARAEADRDGWISADAMLAEMDQIIRETAEHAP